MKTSAWISTLLLGTQLAWHVSAAEIKINDRTLTIPEGFEVELIAGPPLVERPVSAAFDEQGYLYVSDSSGSNDAPDKQLKAKPHRVVRLEDTDGDGKFDRSTVFVDHVMFPEGALWHNGSLYVGAPPSIWKFTDTNADGVADSREEWMLGKTLTGCANDLHGPYAGPDGWIYWCKGAFARQTFDRPGKAPFVTRAAHIFRCRPDGTGIEPVMTGGMDNPVGVVFTRTGERIFSCTFLQEPGGGRRDGVIHAIYGGVYGKVHDVIDEHPRTGDILPVLSHLGPAAPCGVAIYQSEIFGAGYRDNLFTCCFNLHKVLRQELIPDGATFKTKDTDFLASDDPDFHPTDVLEDADGSLIVVDTGGWYKLCCPTSQLAKPDVLGHLYRIRRKGAPQVDDPRGKKILWASLTPTQLCPYLEDVRPAVRKQAIQRLAHCGPTAVPVLAAFRQFASTPAAKCYALWALAQIDSKQARGAALHALADQDNTVRHVAAQACSLWRDPLALTQLQGRLQDPDLQVRRVAIEALGRIGNSAAIPALLNAATKLDATTTELTPSERILEHAIIFALIEIADREATSAGLQSENPRVHRVALVAIDQMKKAPIDPATVTPLLVSTNAVLKETAVWIAARHQDWGDALAGFFREQLRRQELGAADVPALNRQLAPFTRTPAIQQVLAQTLADAQSPRQAKFVALRAMAQAVSAPLPKGWLQPVTETLHTQDPELLQEAIATARSFTLSKAGGTELDRGLVALGDDARTPLETRLLALAAAGPQEKIPAERFEFLLKNISASEPWPRRNSAASVISRAKLDRAQLLALAAALHEAAPSELTPLLAPFGTCSDEAVGLGLVETLKTAKSLSSLRPEVIQSKLEKFPESVRSKAAELYAMLDTKGQKQHLDELQAQLPPGDVRRGQALFNNPKFVCSSCHSIGYRGGHLGPDLTSVGTVRTERDLLESIVYPSASFVRSYEPMCVQTKAGENYTGVLRKDGADEVVLATAPETEVRIPRSDIVEMRQGTVSLMPQGLDTMFTKQELADLVTFLKNTKWGAH